jgi:hypothetical protein
MQALLRSTSGVTPPSDALNQYIKAGVPFIFVYFRRYIHLPRGRLNHAIKKLQPAFLEIAQSVFFRNSAGSAAPFRFRAVIENGSIRALSPEPGSG